MELGKSNDGMSRDNDIIQIMLRGIREMQCGTHTSIP